MLKIIIKHITLIFILVPAVCFSQIISDYLILEDIGMYKISKPEKLIPGFAPIGGPSEKQKSGFIAATGHFQDHMDSTFEVMYLGSGANLASPTVQVTQHIGGDSDQWLSHEVEKQYRDYFGIPSEFMVARDINGSNILVSISGGGLYSWLSNNKVIVIEYHDLQLEKPEPFEVVQAYLAKFPSTLPKFTSADLRTDTNKEKWIKDEMERRLWLGDKCLTWQAAGNSTIPDTLQKVRGNITVFLDYRQKYFGLNSDSDKENLYQIVSIQNLQGMKDKLTGYKAWWADNKSRSINLP